MIDYFLKFTDKEQADSVLYTNEYLAIDEIGIIYKPTGVVLSTELGDMSEMQPTAGWHVNVRHNKEAPELVPYQVFPTSPNRIWA